MTGVGVAGAGVAGAGVTGADVTGAGVTRAEVHGVPEHGCSSSSIHVGDTSCSLYTLNSSEKMKVAFDDAA